MGEGSTQPTAFTLIGDQYYIWVVQYYEGSSYYRGGVILYGGGICVLYRGGRIYMRAGGCCDVFTCVRGGGVVDGTHYMWSLDGLFMRPLRATGMFLNIKHFIGRWVGALRH